MFVWRLTEEATNGNPGAPDTKTLKMISKAAFEVDDYWRIIGILHKKYVYFCYYIFVFAISWIIFWGLMMFWCMI